MTQILVTGDNDLLKVGSYGGVKIMKPHAYLDSMHNLGAG